MEPLIASLASLIAGAVATSLLYRKKTKAEIQKAEAEAKKLEIDGIQVIIMMWKEANAELSSQVKILTGEVHTLREEVYLLRKENETLRQKNPPMEEPKSERPI